jgi:hypothetical protein
LVTKINTKLISWIFLRYYQGINHYGKPGKSDSSLVFLPPTFGVALARLTPRPDGIELGETHCLTVRYGTTGTPRHVTVTDEKGNILVEMSGQANG